MVAVVVVVDVMCDKVGSIEKVVEEEVVVMAAVVGGRYRMMRLRLEWCC